MKKIVTLILSLVLLLTLAVPTFAIEEEFEGIMEVLPINTFADNADFSQFTGGQFKDPGCFAAQSFFQSGSGTAGGYSDS
jgi:hypothetical protein